MSLNTAHLNGGVLIHSGEVILIYSDHVSMEFSGQDHSAFRGTKQGRVYLTTHRLIFNHKDDKDAMQSFSLPFITLSDVELEQPIFGANYIKGKVRAQPNGNWTGEAKFKMLFKHGGAIDFGQAMLKAAAMATRNAHVNDAPPPYVPPESNWYAAPPPAYAPPPQGFYGWVPPSQAFPNQPPSNTVFMTDAPPPYPGIMGGQAMPGQAGWSGAPGNAPPMNYGGGGYPSQGPSNGYGAPAGYGPPAGYGAPPQAAGYGAPPQTAQFGPHPPSAGYPGSSGQYPQPNANGYPHFPSAADAKAAEAAQSAYYDPNRPQMAFVPPPAYYEHPPSYDDASHKKQK